MSTYILSAVAKLSSALSHGLTEALRFIIKLIGADVEPRLVCLNSVCALPVSTLPIDSFHFQRMLNLGALFFTWALLALAALVVAQMLIRAIIPPDARVAVLLRRLVTAKTVVLAFCCIVVLATLATILVNARFLGNIAGQQKILD